MCLPTKRRRNPFIDWLICVQRVQWRMTVRAFETFWCIDRQPQLIIKGACLKMSPLSQIKFLKFKLSLLGRNDPTFLQRNGCYICSKYYSSFKKWSFISQNFLILFSKFEISLSTHFLKCTSCFKWIN
jgi:hypothetical protein